MSRMCWQALQYDATDADGGDRRPNDAAAQQPGGDAERSTGWAAQPFTAVLTAQTTYQNAVIAQVKAKAARLVRYRGTLSGAGRRLVAPRGCRQHPAAASFHEE